MLAHRSIKEWASEDQPREKLIKKGIDSLSNAELLAIIIHTGTKDRSALLIAKELLEKGHHNLLEVGKLSLSDIKQIKGLGEKKSIAIIASLELGRRRQMALALDRPKLMSSHDSFSYLLPYFIDKSVEECYVIYLNAGNRIISIENISNGGITSTIVDSRVIFKKALSLSGVTQIVMAHNHPSGNLSPSEPDKRLTEKIKEGGNLLDIKLLDHIIVAGNQYYSFADNGIL